MTADSKPSLKKAITLKYAVSLYVSSVVGPGILVLPGIAAQIAGPASIVAWIILSLASYPFAYTFATLSARNPQSGGVYAFSKESFGFEVATVTSWLFALWFIAGAPAVTLIAASYLGYAFPLTRMETFIISALIMFTTFVVNYRGIVVSNKVQLAVIVSIISLLIVAIASSAPYVKIANFSPFLPFGLLSIGSAASLIFWSYLGYENVSNVAEEFKDPKRDFHKSIVLSVILVGALYIALSFVTIGTLAYKSAGGVAPFAAILSNVLGLYGAAATAVLSAFIIFGTANAYMTGMSRVIYSAAKDRAFPRFLDHINPRTRAPSRSLVLLVGSGLAVLTVYYFIGIDLQNALRITSGAAILVYVIGSAAGIKLLKEKGLRKLLPIISLAISAIILPFVGPLVFVSLVAALVAYLFALYSKAKRSQAPQSADRS